MGLSRERAQFPRQDGSRALVQAPRLLRLGAWTRRPGDLGLPEGSIQTVGYARSATMSEGNRGSGHTDEGVTRNTRKLRKSADTAPASRSRERFCYLN